MEKYGFVYIWYDRKRKMYYIGCHWGNINDGYICSSNRMRDAYRRRPNDFKRKILNNHITTKEEMFLTEEKWLKLAEKKKQRYYNLNYHIWHWSCCNFSGKIGKKEGCQSPNKGKKFSEETKQKMKIARSKQIISEKTKEKISISLSGRKLSEETKEKMSYWQKGKPKIKLSEETKRKIAIAHTGMTRSEKTKEKISISLSGRKLSEEHKQNISFGIKRRQESNI